ncbi:S-adenosyl-L-methionine-dependent methyltransferase [Triangularia verruculosa]|uniref:S-adenosyl-L-methionine-dependent methyltransferase n=1 Tax=Triangularia verruculosa TaxID=2587418 RepID=A0AAN6XLC5_9PEZI|nr:S-adenosyl-L-methionine-dependent methyltransferase [Triangularia verruculosa]
MESQPSRSLYNNGTGTSQNEQNTQVYQENGRWYGSNKKGAYMVPIDADEQDRLDIFHKFCSVARKERLHIAPIVSDEPWVLDLGCGTGIWTIEMADKYPRGKHVGMDLNLIQPEFIPSNVTFLQKDIESEWPQDLKPGSWDLINMRMLNGSIANWSRLYAEVFRHLKPYYGHVEHIEIDFTPRSDDPGLVHGSFISQWTGELLNVMDNFGRSMRFDSNVTKQRLTEVGFIDIKEEVIQVPLNPWPADTHARDTGRWFNLVMSLGYQPMCLAPFSRGLNKSYSEIDDFVEKVKAEVNKKEKRVFCTMHIFTARRPQ